MPDTSFRDIYAQKNAFLLPVAGHTFQVTVNAVERTAACGILTGGHVILGLPGETHRSIVAQAKDLSRLPLTTLKMHQLQLIRGTRMALEYERNPEDFHLFNVDEYVDLVVDYVEHLRPDIVLERFVSQLSLIHI